MTALSVNLNKIALLRNARGRDCPNVVDYAQKLIDLGVQGITVHPRSDERHIKRQDVYDLAELVCFIPNVEFNVEGYPSDEFMCLIEDVRPNQCTLVPDAPDQLTSDHGWDMEKNQMQINELGVQLNSWDVRSSVFLDPVPEQVQLVADTSVDRIELYTERFAQAHAKGCFKAVWQQYADAAQVAQSLGLGVNAGHDLDLLNLADFLTIPGILEVSIGHALTVESLEQGRASVIQQYLAICQKASKT